MSDLTLYADLSARKLVTSDGGAVTLPVLVLGDQCVCSLRLMVHGDSDALVEANLNVRTLRASIGNVLTPPTDGGFTLRFNGDPSAALNPGSSAIEMKAALDALDPGGAYQLQEVIASNPGCWLLRFATTSAVPLAVAANTLKPESFVRIRAFDQSGRRWHEVRLVQTPVVFTGTHERVLPAPPGVERIRSGSTDGDFKQNEVQALIVPSGFRGTYYLRWDFRTTKLLGIDDGPQEIAAALDAMFASGGLHFDVTNPEPDRAYIEFIGELGGDPQPLIEVTVHYFEPGVLTFTLDLARAELASALRDTAQVELPFEVEMEVVDDGQDAADPAVPGRLITLCQQPIKIAREQIWEELADVPAIDWLRPPQPRDYIPFTRDQIITGSQHYIAVIGDGVQRSFNLDHNLVTSAYHLTIRENKANGRRLLDNEFALHFPSDNEAALDFPIDAPLPEPDGLVVTISSAGPRSVFERHTHYASEIIGLDDRFYTLGARVAAIEQLLPTAPPTANAASAATGLSIPFASFAQLVPGKWRPGFDARGAFSNGTGLPSRGGGLLPAIHSASATNAILPDHDEAHAARVERVTQRPVSLDSPFFHRLGRLQTAVVVIAEHVIGGKLEPVFQEVVIRLHRGVGGPLRDVARAKHKLRARNFAADLFGIRSAFHRIHRVNEGNHMCRAPARFDVLIRPSEKRQSLIGSHVLGKALADCQREERKSCARHPSGE